MSVYQKLQKAQLELNAPKNQWNKHGNYYYRSCEDVVEGAKNVCKDNDLLLTITDDMVMLGDRFYIKATAKVTDLETSESVEVNGFAREAVTQKGMQDAQLSGSTSSYARKYALNGLFAIDDEKDADTNEFKDRTSQGTQTTKASLSEAQIKRLFAIGYSKGFDNKAVLKSVKKDYGHDKAEDLTKKEYDELCGRLEKYKKPEPEIDHDPIGFTGDISDQDHPF